MWTEGSLNHLDMHESVGPVGMHPRFGRYCEAVFSYLPEFMALGGRFAGLGKRSVTPVLKMD